MSKDPDEWIGVAQVAEEMGYTPRQAWEYVRRIGVPATNATRMELARFRRADFEEARRRSQTPITPRARTGAAVGTNRASPAAAEGGDRLFTESGRRVGLEVRPPARPQPLNRHPRRTPRAMIAARTRIRPADLPDLAHDFLTAEEERELAGRVARGGRAARDRLVEGNLLLARLIADRYAGRGLDGDDLEQHARLGLFDAALAFDPDRGRFTTIAKWSIRRRLTEAVCGEGSTIRVPRHIHEARRRAAARGHAPPAGSGLAAHLEAARRDFGFRARGIDPDARRGAAVDRIAHPGRLDDRLDLAAAPGELAAPPGRRRPPSLRARWPTPAVDPRGRPIARSCPADDHPPRGRGPGQAEEGCRNA